MKKKSDVFYYFKIFKNQVENESNANIKLLTTGGGGEYFSHNYIQIICIIVAYADNLHAGIHPNRMGLQNRKIG